MYEYDDMVPDPYEKPPLPETENLVWPLSEVGLSTLTSKVGGRLLPLAPAFRVKYALRSRRIGMHLGLSWHGQCVFAVETEAGLNGGLAWGLNGGQLFYRLSTGQWEGSSHG